MQFVVGFMFSKDGTRVALIRKARPDWQKGKLNGIGGKVEYTETPVQAMVREFKEETGVQTSMTDWTHFCVLGPPDVGSLALAPWSVHFFKTSAEADLATLTDEEVDWYSVSDVLRYRFDIVPNLLWLLPLSLSGNLQAEVHDGNVYKG